MRDPARYADIPRSRARRRSQFPISRDAASTEPGSTVQGGSGRLRAVSHPNLGLPPLDETAGFPQAAERLRASAARLGTRALETALDRDPTLRDRAGEDGLRHLLRDMEVIVDRLARCVAADDVRPLREWAEWVAPVYRRRQVPLDDVIALAEGLRASMGAVLPTDERVPADAAIDAAAEVLRWHRRLAGDGKKPRRLVAALYRGG